MIFIISLIIYVLVGIIFGAIVMFIREDYDFESGEITLYILAWPLAFIAGIMWVACFSLFFCSKSLAKAFKKIEGAKK